MSSSKIPFLRFLLLSTVVALAASQSLAYTLVLKSGRQFQVGDNLVVSGQSVICEVGNDLSISVQLATIDIAATERANHEAQGSFFQRAGKVRTEPAKVETMAKSAPRASVTNAQLEVFRVRRIENEKAYEVLRKEQGLPSVEELRLKSTEQVDKASKASQSVLAREQTQEEYWRARSSSLRTEINANDSQIRYLQDRLNELPNGVWTGGLSGLSSFPVVIGSRANVGPSFVPGPHIIPQATPNFTPRSFGGHRPPVRFGNRPTRFAGQFLGFPLTSFDDGTANALLIQLDQMRVQHARLQALWQNLEDEARRAGAYPGWLRP